VVVLWHDVVVAETDSALRLLETSHPPSWYLPPVHCRLEYFVEARGSSFCEWKGAAQYWSVTAGGATVDRAVWSYPSPAPEYADLKDHLAFYASVFDCFVDDVRVEAQPGEFYGGWITADVVGPFKGIPGSMGW
jgi:uncharacterized protein (DUF427 family)